MDNQHLVDLVRKADFHSARRSPGYEAAVEAVGRVDRALFIPENAYMSLCDVDQQALKAVLEKTMDLDDVLELGSEVLRPIMDSVMAHLFSVVQSGRVFQVQSRALAYNDVPVYIGKGQTCSQPSLVAFMADKLELESGLRVLEIGAGCGYSAAVSKNLIGADGFLVSVEYIADLAEVACANLSSLFRTALHLESVKNISNEGNGFGLSVLVGDGSAGVPHYAPFDRIYLTAGVGSGFDADVLVGQLNPERGILIYPEQFGSLVKRVYEKGVCVLDEKFEGVAFVPLVGVNGLEPEYSAVAAR